MGGLEDVAELGGGGLFLQATAKWFGMPQFEHVFPHAGHLSLFRHAFCSEFLEVSFHWND